MIIQRCDDRQWMLDDYVTILLRRPGGSVQRMRSPGIFSTTILRSDWAVLVIRYRGFRRDLLLAYLALERPIFNFGCLLDDEYLLNPVE